MNILITLALVAVSFCTIDMVVARRGSFWLSTKKKTEQSLELCQSGDGSSYRGFVSISYRGHRCHQWKKFEYPGAATVPPGSRNYCRNPDRSLMPWCYVRRGRRYTREFCSIPECPITTAKPEVRVEDTEQTCGEKTLRRQSKIVGGSVVPIESQPWVAAIFKRGSFQCGGSLIAPCWVLTAAHCFPEGKSTETRRLSVYLGKSYSNDTDVVREQEFTVEELILHENYIDTEGYNNDIALLRISGSDGKCAMRTDSVRTVCLPPHNTMLPPGSECMVAGYGKQSALGMYSKALKEATVTLVPQSSCEDKEYYGNAITANMFCAASPTWSSDACYGDSGGPLVCDVLGRKFVFGVISWGDGCAKRNKPGVYTRITNFNNWISEKTQLPAFTAGVMYPTK